MTKIKVKSTLVLSVEEIKEEIENLKNTLDLLTNNKTLSYLVSQPMCKQLTEEIERLERLIK